MRRGMIFAFGAFLGASVSLGQQVVLPALPPPAQPSAAPSSTANLGEPGVVAPELLPNNIPVTTARRCEKLDGTVKLSATIDLEGVPQSVSLTQPLGTDLDKLALIIAKADRFKPGSRDSSPVSVALVIKIEMQACVEDVPGSKTGEYTVRLRSQPSQQLEPPPMADTFSITATPRPLDKAISAPRVISSREAEYTDKARMEKINGSCLISLLVDAQGKPQNVRIVKSLDPGLDQNALNAVRQFRFKPARDKDGAPVAVFITIEVVFQLYN
jgi:TonB family protein